MLGVNTLLDLLVLISELLSLFDHPLDLFLDKRPLSMVMVIFPFACRFVLGTHIQNFIGINHDGDLHLKLATMCWRDSSQLELAQQVFVLRHGSFTLET